MHPQLFLGIPLSIELKSAIELAPPERANLLHSAGFFPLLFQGQLFFGKFLPTPIELHALESMQAHLISLVRLLLPQTAAMVQAQLFACPSPTAEEKA